MSVPCLQCSVFIGVCALVDSELVIPCDVNRGCELWSGAPGCWPTLDQTCIAANACADFEWVIFPDTVCSVCWAELVAWAGLLICGFTSLWLVGFCDSCACVALRCAGLCWVHHMCCGLSDLTCDSLWKFGMSPHLSYGLLVKQNL